MKTYRIPACLFIFVIILQLQLRAQPPKEKILYNGKIFTSASPLTVEAVSISGDKIVAAGSLADVKKSISANATMIDLQGKCLLPGLVDSHNHALSGGENLMSATVNDVLLTKEELKSFAQKTLETKRGMRGDVLYIRGFNSGTWAAVQELDELFNTGIYEQQPVLFRGSDGHTSWANKVMLKRGSVDAAYIKSLPPEEQKFFGFNENFEPNGLISEHGKEKIWAVLPKSSINPRDAGITAIKHLNGLGITAWMDPAAGDVSEGENNSSLRMYKMLSDETSLTAHVSAVLVAKGDQDPLPQIELVKKFQEQFKSVNNVAIIGFKIFSDGVLEYPTQTAAVSIPYKNSNELGSLMFDPPTFKNFVASADKAKLVVHIHAIGDRAVTESLNAFEYARKTNGDSGIPHSITHLQLVKPVDFKRFSSLNVMASFQLLWAAADIYTVDLVKPYLDTELYAHQYPAQSLLNAGAVIGGASDWPVSSANPFDAIAMAETRLGKNGVLDANEIMTRMSMLKAYTIEAAKIIRLEKKIGSIEPGKQADFVLLDRDVTSVSPTEVKGTQVLWTMFGGDVVYKK